MGLENRIVHATDLNKDVLDNCFRNVLLNSRKFKSSVGTLRIRQMDWQESWPPMASHIEAETSTDDHSLLVCLLSLVNLAYWAYLRKFLSGTAGNYLKSLMKVKIIWHFDG